ncbi:unnamed protein product [Fusarium equiseti]|uniref:HNH nuclease domain-containing protein n=1 Tax=Fusarium equiseti TaxID=61235 RepID=A0A8J2NF73_FUSEQ|nr:unnamed protein product [Fusarium equiseti]
MSTHIPNSMVTHPPVVPLERLEGDPQEAARRDAVVLVCDRKLKKAGFPKLTHDDAMCIWSDPWRFETDLDAKGITDSIRDHKIFSALFLTNPTHEAAGIASLKRGPGGQPKDPKRSKQDNDQKGKGPAKPADPKPKKDVAERSTSEKDQARKRDGHMCRWQWTPHPDMSHFFPFAATKDAEAAAKTADCFQITKPRFGLAHFDKYHPIVSKPGELEAASNLQALGKSLHDWEDRGYLAFKFSKIESSDNNIWFVTIVLYWLPYLYPETATSATANLSSGGPNNTVIRARRQLDDAYHTRYPPRHPPIGNGVMKAFFRDRNEIVSGRSVKFQHRSEEEARNFKAMVDYHWFGMSILTFRGVTNGFDPRSRPSGSGGGGDGPNTRNRAFTLPGSSSMPTLPVGHGRHPGAGGHTPTGSIDPRGTNSPC